MICFIKFFHFHKMIFRFVQYFQNSKIHINDYLVCQNGKIVSSRSGLFKVSLANKNDCACPQSLRTVTFPMIDTLTFFTNWSSPNLGHNMISKLECSEVIVSKCMHFYSIHVIAEYNLSGYEIICRQIIVIWQECQGQP